MQGMLRSMKETRAHISCLRHALSELPSGRLRATPLMIYRDSRKARLAKALAQRGSGQLRAEVIT